MMAFVARYSGACSATGFPPVSLFSPGHDLEHFFGSIFNGVEEILSNANRTYLQLYFYIVRNGVDRIKQKSYTRHQLPLGGTMTRWFNLALLSLLLIVSSVDAWEISESFIKCYVGLREDSLKWKVKGKRHSPLIVEETCFDSFKMIEKGIYSEITFCDRFALKADANYSFVYNRPNGWAFDLSVAVGYRFSIWCNSFQITPYVGYQIDQRAFPQLQ